jgi:hypothetical protein
MFAVKTSAKPKPMKISAIKEKAQSLGIEPGKMKKEDLIHAIQRAENNTPCFGKSGGQCPYVNCCFMYDCLKIH